MRRLAVIVLLVVGSAGLAGRTDWRCPYAGLKPKPTDPKNFPNQLKSVGGFMLRFAPSWQRSPEESYARDGGRRFSQVYYSRLPDLRGVAEGTRRVRFERHANAGNAIVPRHSEIHAHFEVYRNGDWYAVPNPAGAVQTSGHGSGWLPGEGIPPGFFDSYR